MKTIKLTQGKNTIVDNEDYKKYNQFKWCAAKMNNIFYAERADSSTGKRKIILLHRVIMNAKTKKQIDHINGNTLDNRKNNLRFCTQKENIRNQKIHKNNNSGYKGVFWHELTKKWLAKIMVNYRNIHLGLFTNKTKAAQAYNKAAIKYFKKYARLNKIKKG